jgi:mRNA-degrading endonuclease toxin of MazEF toxin-antitoxin module
MGANPPSLPQPRRGQIWSAVFPGDPPGKFVRPVLIVSTDARNTHPRASTVLAVPFSTTLTDVPTHIRLQPGESGLEHASELQPENISVLRKETLRPRPGTRTVSEDIIRRLARNVVLSMGVQPKDI